MKHKFFIRTIHHHQSIIFKLQYFSEIIKYANYMTTWQDYQFNILNSKFQWLIECCCRIYLCIAGEHKSFNFFFFLSTRNFIRGQSPTQDKAHYKKVSTADPNNGPLNIHFWTVSPREKNRWGSNLQASTTCRLPSNQ